MTNSLPLLLLLVLSMLHTAAPEPAAPITQSICSNRSDLAIATVNAQHFRPIVSKLSSHPQLRYYETLICSPCMLPDVASAQKCSPPRSPGAEPSLPECAFGVIAGRRNSTESELCSTEKFDLAVNPQRWTHYTGAEGSLQVWRAIHQIANNAQGEGAKILSQLVDGMHASITVHVSNKHCLAQVAASCARWGVNHQQLNEQILDRPDRVSALWFTFMVLQKAVVSVSPQLLVSGWDDATEADSITALIKQLQKPPADSQDVSCIDDFVQTELLSGEATATLAAMHKNFRQIRTLVDCVGCQRCKLWGVVHLEGFEVALQLLVNQSAGVDAQPTQTQVVALLNTFNQLSLAVGFVSEALKITKPRKTARSGCSIVGLSEPMDQFVQWVRESVFEKSQADALATMVSSWMSFGCHIAMIAFTVLGGLVGILYSVGILK